MMKYENSHAQSTQTASQLEPTRIPSASDKLKPVHFAVRLIAFTLATYGLIAFVLAIDKGVSYQSVFVDHSLTSVFPFWLQGAFVGGLLILITVVAVQLYMLVKRKLEGSFNELVVKLVALIVLALLPLQGNTYSPDQVQINRDTEVAKESGSVDNSQSNESTWIISDLMSNPLGGLSNIGGEKTPQKEDSEARKEVQSNDSSESKKVSNEKPLMTEEKIKKLNAAFDLIDDIKKTIPRDTFDHQVVIDKVGKDYNKLFAWIRDNTLLVPYKGMLKGDLGVLMERKGNSLDRALLLHRLLETSGYTVRLANGALDQSTAEQLYEKSLDRKLSIPEKPPVDMKELFEKSAKFNINENDITKKMLESSEKLNLAIKEMRQRIKIQSQLLGSLDTQDDNYSAQVLVDQQISALKDHWWLQVNVDNKWVDLDPSATDSQAGQSLTSVSRTLAPKDIPSASKHTVTVSIILESYDGMKFKETNMVQYEFNAADALGKTFSIQHVPLNWPENIPKDKNNMAEIKKIIIAQEEWMPMLSFDGKTNYKHYFNMKGDVFDSADFDPTNRLGKGVAGKTTEKLGEITGMFSSLSGENEKPENKMPTGSSAYAGVTAEWIEYVINTPGKAKKTIRKPIFDLVGTHARQMAVISKPVLKTEMQKLNARMPMLGTIGVSISSAELTSDYVNFQSISHYLTLRKPLIASLREQVNALELRKTIDALSPVTFKVDALMVARKSWRDKNTNYFIDEANIVAFYLAEKFTDSVSAKKMETYDIVNNHLTVLEKDKSVHYLNNLSQGIIDTNIEYTMLAQDCTHPCKQQETVASVTKDSSNLLLIHSKTDLDKLRGYDKDLIVSVQNELEGGNVVVLAGDIKNRTLIGWWRIDPTTGNLLGIGMDGRGAAMMEYVIHTVTLGFCLKINMQNLIKGLIKRDITHCSHGVTFAETSVCLLGAHLAFISQLDKSLELIIILVTGLAGDIKDIMC